jgi:hypothetical protein
VSKIKYLDLKSQLYSSDDFDEVEKIIYGLLYNFEECKRQGDYESEKRILRMIDDRMLKLNKKSFMQVVVLHYCSSMAIRYEGIEKAFTYAKQAYDIMLETIPPFFISDADVYSIKREVMELYANMLMLKGNNGESKLIRSQIYKESRSKFGSKSFETIVAEQNLLMTEEVNAENISMIANKLKSIIHKREKLNLKDKFKQDNNQLHIIYAKQMIGNSYEKIDDNYNAIYWMQQAAKNALDIYGLEDNITQDLLHSYSSLLVNTRCYSDAILFLEQIYDSWKSKLPDRCEMMVSIRYLLGVSYAECGRIKEAKELLMNCFITSLDENGPHHKETLKYRKEYAICLGKEGNHEDALELMKEVEEFYLNKYGEDNSSQLFNIRHSINVEKNLISQRYKA